MKLPMPQEFSFTAFARVPGVCGLALRERSGVWCSACRTLQHLLDAGATVADPERFLFCIAVERALGRYRDTHHGVRLIAWREAALASAGSKDQRPPLKLLGRWVAAAPAPAILTVGWLKGRGYYATSYNEAVLAVSARAGEE